MKPLRVFLRRLGGLFRQESHDRELAEEIETNLQMHIADNRRAGMTDAEARRQALIRMGGVAPVQEAYRGQRSLPAFDSLLQDVRYGVRGLLHSPVFALTAMLTLALGIGASTAIYSVVDAVLLRALPYPDSQELVRVWEKAPDGHGMNLADPNFDDLRAQNHTFAELVEYAYFMSSVSGGSEPVRVNAAEVSRGFFEALGVAPFRGRAFAAGEQRLHGAPAAIVSYGYWQRYLGGAADLSKLQLKLEGGVFPVVGVMPEAFDFPSGIAVWIPRQFEPSRSRTAHNWRVLGRIRDGVTVDQARADLDAIARRIKAEYGKDVDLTGAVVLPLADAMVGDVRTALLTLLGAVGLLLLVACANVAGLLVARTAARRKELAVRAVLGAGRGRLMQQFLAESFALSAAAGAAGILIAFWAVKLLPSIIPANLPRHQTIAVNPSVLLFALAATVAVAVALGLFAAWRASRADLQAALASGSRGNSAAGSSQRLRALLVTGEIAATLVILVGAGLLGRSFLRLVSTNPGFNPQNLVTMEFSIPVTTWQVEESDAIRQIHLLDEILNRLRAIPGVQNAGLTGAMPVAAGDDLADGTFLILDGEKPPSDYREFGRMAQNPAMAGHALYCMAGEDYFQTMSIPLLRGRMFGRQDQWDSPHVAVISDSLARRRWPNQNPIGQVIEFGNMDGNLKPLTIVGVVGDVRAEGLNAPPSSIIYVDYRQRGLNANSSPTILVRAAIPAGQIVPAARRVFQDLAPEAPVKFSTFADEMGGWLADRRFLLLLVGIFAAAALTLAAVGIYGVVAFSASRRTQEIGIRMALGGQPRDVLSLILGEGIRLAVIGVAVGIAVSLLVTRLLSALLFGVSATDPATFAGVALLLALVALLAAFLPARRAMRLDPNTALRYE